MDEEQLKLLYNDYAKDKGFADFNEFKGLIADEGARKVFFDESNKDLGFKDFDDFNNTIGVKKKSGGENSGNPLTSFLKEDPEGVARAVAAPAAKSKEILPAAWQTNYKYQQKEEKKKEDYKKSLLEYYDTAEQQFGDELATNPNLIYDLHKDFLEKRGDGERLKYLQQKELSERVVPKDNRNPQDKFDPIDLKGALAKEAENIKNGVQSVYPSTETGLKIKEEALSFRQSLLNEKKAQVLKNKDTTTKLATLEQLKVKIDEQPENQQLVDQYNAILQDPEMQKLNKVYAQEDMLNKETAKLLVTDKEIFRKRFDKLAEQEAVDERFRNNPDPRAGIVNQFGRSATKLVSDLLQLPSLFDSDNEYGAVDAWGGVVDKTVDHVNDSLFPVPSDYSAPMFTNDDKGNTTWRTDLILPKTAKVVGDMSALFLGAGKVTSGLKILGVGGKAAEGMGLFASSYTQTFNEYKKEGIEAGLSPEEAHWFAHTSSAGQSALELLSPQKYLWAAKPKTVAESFLKNIKSGMSRTAALKSAGAFTTQQIAGENLQELTQNISDSAVKHYTNKVLDKEAFTQEDFLNQALETMVLTTIVGGAPAAVASGAKVAANKGLYDEAIQLIAENKTKYMPMLKSAIDEQGISVEKVDKILADIEAVPTPQQGVPMYVIDGEVSTKEAVSKRIKEGKTQGIAVYNDPETGKLLSAKPRIRVKGEVVQENPVSTESEQPEKVITKRVETLSTPEDIKKFTSEQTTEEGKRLGKVLNSAQKVLRNIAPDLKINLYDGDEVGNEILTKMGETPYSAYGFYDPKTQSLYINREDFKSDTPFHESIHPLLNAVKQIAPEKFAKFADEASVAKVALADGTVVDYLTNNDGNKEEALTEFLADYASNKFDETPTLFEKAKKLVNDFLEAIGISPSDLGVDLADVKSVKDMANVIAKSFKEGKAIKLQAPAPTALGTSSSVDVTSQPQRKKETLKLNQTAKRVAEDENTVYKQIQKDVISNPEKYSYTPQDIKDKKLDLAAMSDEDLVKETESVDKLIQNISFNNNFAVLSAIEAINRSVEQGKDTRPIFDKMRQLGTGLGQLLRQFGELKSTTSAGVINIVTKGLEAQNRKLTDEQAKKLQGLADEHIKTKAKVEKAQKDYNDNPSKDTDKALQSALDERDKKFTELSEFVGQVIPQGVDTMIGTILQGNLLTTKSIVSNVVGNLLFTPLRQVELMAGDLGAYIANRIHGRNTINPVEMWFSAALNGIQGFKKSLGTTFKNAVTGNTHGSAQTLEVRRGLHPLTAGWQLFTKEGRKTLPVNTKGNVGMSLYLEKSLEATTGIPAELMFRMLYLGDAPFKDGARKASAFRMFSEAGGKGSENFRKFILNMTPEQKEQLDLRANEATFSDERTIAKGADTILSAVRKSIDFATEKLPWKPFRDFIGTTLQVAQKANVPFVRVPSNLVQYLLELTMPIIPMMAGIRYAKSDVRKASQMFARAGIGFSFLYMADALIEGGCVVAAGEGDEEEKKALKFQVGAPNTINISAMRRTLLGIQDLDNPFKEGDKYIDFSKLGPMGVALVARAQFREKVKSEGQDYKELAFFPKQIEILNAGLRSSMELPFLQGTAAMMDAIKDKGIQSYAAELGNTMSAVLIPNSVSVFTRSRRETMLRAKDKDVLNSFVEKQSIKLFPALEDNVAGVYPVVSMWGEPVKQNKEEGAFGDLNPYIRQFFDITNGGVISDPITVEIYNLSERLGEVPVTAPSQKVTLFDKDDNEVSVTLDEGDYTQLQMLAGQLKKLAIADLMQEEDWKKMSDAEKAEAIKEENNYANSAARDYILGDIESAQERGEVVIDPVKKTYSYLQIKPFDYSQVSEHKEEEIK